MWWRYLLVIGIIIYIFVSHHIHTAKQRRKLDRLRGCTCPKSFWGKISHNCPVHSPFYIRYYRTVDNRISCDKIYASGGTTQPICKNCLNSILPAGYIVQQPIVTEICHTCGLLKENCIELPERDRLLWVDNK